MKKIAKYLIVLIVISACIGLMIGCTPNDTRSAYQIAKDNGFMGTEMQWLNSLKGDKGQDGLDGLDGENGKDGKNGKDGQNAPNITIDDIFELYKEYHPDATFDEFLEAFLNIEINNAKTASTAVLQSVVSVYCLFDYGYTSSQSAGSGIIYKIIDEYAYIITNYHVIYDSSSVSPDKTAYEIAVFSYGSEWNQYAVSAEFVGGSITKDIAVIKALVSDFNTQIKAVETSDSNDIRLGEGVIAVGNASAAGISVTSGVVSVDSEYIYMTALDSSAEIQTRVIRTDTAINRGNSGGGLFNLKGQLVGIVNAKTIANGVENIGYAIPINTAKGIADSIIENNGKKAVLGIKTQIIESKTVYNTEGGYIEIIETTAVTPVDASSQSCGYLFEGDILVAAWLNDTTPLEITRLFYLSDYLFKAKLNDTLYIKLIREETEIIVEIVLDNSFFKDIYNLL